MDNFASSSNIVFIYTKIVIVIILTFANIPTSFARHSEEFNICSKTFSCGNITGLSYPFYSRDRPQYCGHPGFELLNCDQYTRKIQIMIMSQTYYVFNINQTSSTMNVARQDFLDGFGCPLKLVNITIDFSIFEYTSLDANISLVYDCASNCSSFSCPTDGGLLPICFMTPKMMLKLNMSQGMCGNRLFLPVHLTDFTAMDEAGKYLPSGAWNGFELKWRANDDLCRECVRSGGQCGHDSKSNKFFCFCSDESKCPFPGSSMNKGRRIAGISLTKLTIVLLACFSAAAVCTIIILIVVFKRRYSSEDRLSRRERRVNVEAFLRGHGSSGPKRYTYNDLKKITNAFKHKLGEGGYGSVYKGTLQNGKLVAVKMLHKSKEDAEEFINEVASIGNTNHVNVVKLFGFCYEGHKRALVYEFMINGSLEKFLYTGENNPSLGWTTLFNISVGVARGLEYLHRGCNIRILHFDIKPHNILLDENFCPKISDFGLAKSCPQKDSIVSMSEARGTVGYIAPEVFLKSFGGVSYKSDVYSYGMLVLEMVGCRRKVDVVGEVSSEQSFPQWIYEQLEVGEESEQEMAVIDEEMEMQRKMIVVSLWCVKTNPSSRPTMSEVVEMLEGKPQSLQIPRASSLSLSLRSQH
ncbi:hypothetical protein RND81_10G121200 [Saponaria officinalis]|uniref:non-specific serine/threonine protein kinase n=1 Tax=Saponaria officinalis TaxID=3572 RepID=A0AAW1I1F8_SAPOF